MTATERILDRGTIGTMIAPSELDDELYLDFVEGLRAFTLTDMHSAARGRALSALAEREARGEPPVASVEEARRVLDRLPEVAARNRLLRTVQEMNWQRARETYEARRAELEAALAASEQEGPGSLELDPGWVDPAYYKQVPFHIQPGGYGEDPLAGCIYHYGTKVFYAGRNNTDEAKVALVGRVPLPGDGSVARILDVACSVGQCTTAWSDRCPQAEVWGVDVAAPMLRYAHARAVRMGSAVHFSQQAAESLRFEDESFDLVFVSILFHELPVEIGELAVAQAARVLRPGGIYAVNDFPPAPRPFDALYEYNRAFDNDFNCEPYADAFVHSDFTGTLERHFDSVVVEQTGPGTQLWVCRR